VTPRLDPGRGRRFPAPHFSLRRVMNRNQISRHLQKKMDEVKDALVKDNRFNEARIIEAKHSLQADV